MTTSRTQPIQTAADLQAQFQTAMNLFWTTRKLTERKQALDHCLETLTTQRALNNPSGQVPLAHVATSLAAVAQMHYHLAVKSKKRQNWRLGFACKFFHECMTLVDQFGAGSREDLALACTGAAQAYAQRGNFPMAFSLLHNAGQELVLPGRDNPLSRDMALSLAGQAVSFGRAGKRRAIALFEAELNKIQTAIRGE